MRIPVLLSLLGLTAQLAHAQPLTCPSSGASQQNCGTFHYHVQMWRPDTKTPTDVLGVNRFASMTACESARALEAQRNKAVIDFFKKLKPDGPEQLHRFGPCHCDQTIDRNSPVYLDESARAKQLRSYEEVNGRIRERLLDRGAATESEIVRSLAVPPPNIASTQWTKNVPQIPTGTPKVAATTTEAELKNTAIGTEAVTRTAVIDMPLAPIDLKTLQPRVTSTPTELAERETDEAEESESPADAYINYETARVDEIVKVSAAISDDALRTKIMEACMERLQLLTNLRSITEQAGPKSRLALAAIAAKDEAARIKLATQLFGPTMQTHWAPADAKNAVIEFPPDIVNDSIAVLRDPAGRYPEAQRKLALYFVLARNASLVSNQELWISETIDEFLAK